MRGNGPTGLFMMAACVFSISTANSNQISNFQVAQNTVPAAGSSEGSGMAQKPGNADEPKKYQPVNPAPDPRAAPTGTTSGVGSSSGGRPEQQPASK